MRRRSERSARATESIGCFGGLFGGGEEVIGGLGFGESGFGGFEIGDVFED